MKQSQVKQYPGLIFRETFNTERETRLNGGVPTNVEFRNGKVTPNDNGYINYKKLVKGDISIRLVGSLYSFDNYSYIVDFRHQSGVGYLYVNKDTGIIKAPYASSKKYINGELNDAASINSKLDIVVTNITDIDSLNSFIIAGNGGSFYWDGEIDFIEIYNRELSAAEIHNLYHNVEQIDIPNFNGAKPKIFESTYANSFANVSGQRTDASIDVATESLKGVVSIDISPIGFKYNSTPSGLALGDKVNVSFEMKSSRNTVLKYIGSTSQDIDSNLVTIIKNQTITSTFNTFEFELNILSLSSFYIAFLSSDVDVDDELFIRNIVFKKVQPKLLVDYTSSKGVVENRIKPNPLGLGKQRIVGVFDGTDYLLSEVIQITDGEDIKISLNSIVNGTQQTLLSGIKSTPTRISYIALHATNFKYLIGRVIYADESGYDDITLSFTTELIGNITLTVSIDGNTFSVQRSDTLETVSQTYAKPIYFYATYIGTYYNIASKFTGKLWDIISPTAIYPLAGDTIDTISQVAATNNGVTFKDITPLPTLTNILYKQLGTYWSAYFNGVDSKVDLGYDPIGVGDITVMGWFRRESLINSFIIGNGGKSIGSSTKFLVYIYNNRLYFRRRIDTYTGIIDITQYTMQDVFFFITSTSLGIVNFYLGLKDTPLEITGTPNQDTGIPEEGTEPLVIGNASDSSIPFDGLIPFLRVYQGILPIEQGQQWLTHTLKQLT